MSRDAFQNQPVIDSGLHDPNPEKKPSKLRQFFDRRTSMPLWVAILLWTSVGTNALSDFLKWLSEALK